MPIVALAAGWVAAHAEGPLAPTLDPHAALRGTDVPLSACALCHTPGPTEADPALQLPAEQICASCHTGEDHAGVEAHFGVGVGAAVSARALAAGLPLIEGRIGCTTCHDPHPPPPDRPVARAALPTWWTSRFGAPAAPSDLTRNGDALCTSCHDPAAPGLDADGGEVRP